MIKVKLLTSLAFLGGKSPKGAELELQKAHAEQLIKNGVAVEVTTSEPDKKPKQAKKPAK